jgi:Tfp pilus assembly protein PilF
MAYFGKGELHGALVDFDDVIRLDPDNAQAYRRRAEVHQKLGNVEKATEDIANARRLELQASAGTPPQLTEDQRR